MNEVTQESLPSNRDPLHMYCIVLGIYMHTHVVSCTSQNSPQTCMTDMGCDIIMKRQ